MVEYRGYCRPLKGKVDFEVEAVNSFDTAKGVKWQVKGTHNDYNISVFTSEGKAKELLTLMAEKNIHEAEDIILTYDMEELIPYPLASEENIKGTLYEMEELIPYPVAAEEEEEDEEDEGDDDYGAEEIPLQTEGLDPKYLKKDGTPDLRYKASREWVKSQETTEMVEVSVAPHIGLNLDGPAHLLGMVDLWESEGGSVENTSSFEAETKEFVPFIGATRVIPKAVYYQMALNLPQSVSVTPTEKGESIILGFHEQDYSRVEGLIEAYGIPEGGPQEEDKGVSMFQAEEESTLPLPTEWAEDLSNFGAENIPFEAEEFYGEETEVMSLDEYYSNVMDFKDSDTVNVDFAGNVIVKSNEGGIYDGEEFEAPLEPDHLCFTCGNLLREFTHNCINPAHTHPVYGCSICDDVCSFCDKQTQIESFNSPSREDWLYYCKSCGVQNSLPTTCHACGSDEVKIVVMAGEEESFGAETSIRTGEMGDTAYHWYVDGDETIKDREGEPLINRRMEDEIDDDIQHNIKIFLERGEKKGEAYHEVDDLHDRFDEPQSYGIFYSWGAESFGAEDCKNVKAFVEYTCAKCGAEKGLYEVEDGNFYRFDPDIGDCDCGGFDVHSNEFITCRECDDYFHHRGDGWDEHLRIIMNRNDAESFEAFTHCDNCDGENKGEDGRYYKKYDCFNCDVQLCGFCHTNGLHDCPNADYTDWNRIYNCKYCGDPMCEKGGDEHTQEELERKRNAESFKEWSEEELKEKDHPDKDVTFDNWLDEEIEEHGDVKLSVWKDREHEEKEHQAEDDWEDFEEGIYEDDWDPDFPEFEDKPKLSTVATIVGVGALVAYLAPNEIKNMLEKLR